LPADLADIHGYDHIDLPPLCPIITCINRHRGICPGCHGRFAAAAPEALLCCSPFGSRLGGTYHPSPHPSRRTGFELLVDLVAEVFGDHERGAGPPRAYQQ
jgi:transposase